MPNPRSTFEILIDSFLLPIAYMLFGYLLGLLRHEASR